MPQDRAASTPVSTLASTVDETNAEPQEIKDLRLAAVMQWLSG